MILKFLKFWVSEEYRPDIVTGWNIEKYDIPYIVNRIKRLFGNDEVKRLSPWGILQEKNIFARGKDIKIFVPLGVSILDYYGLYRKFTQNQQESYTLDHIAFVEVGKRKLDYSEFGSLDELYAKDYTKFVNYNVADIDRVADIDAKKKFINLVLSMAYNAKVNYIDTLGSVLIWDVIIHNYLLKQNIVIPQNKRGEFVEIPGGFVKEPKAGRYDWIVSFDLQSLYPHLIMNFNISPETFIGIDENWSMKQFDEMLNKTFKVDPNSIQAANGAKFRKDTIGFLPALMKEQFELRKQYKKQMIELEQKNVGLNDPDIENQIDALFNAQWSKKIFLNSLYGSLANKYFRFYDWRLASSITLSGQLTVKWIHNRLNIYINELFGTKDIDYVIAADTDSVYLNFALIGDKLSSEPTNKIVDTLDAICKNKIEPFIKKSFEELSNYVNANENNLFMKRESIAERAIWRAAKNYAMLVWDAEGVRYDEPELEVKGLEIVRSTTPAVCKEVLKKCVKIIMSGAEKELIAEVLRFKNEYWQMGFQDIAFAKGVNGLDDYKNANTIYGKGTPMHVRASLLYNDRVKTLGLKNEQLIYNGDKIKFCYLKLPNPLHENVIAAPRNLPESLDLNKYIDHETMWTKSFLDPLDSLLAIIGWNHEEKSSLEDYF